MKDSFRFDESGTYSDPISHLHLNPIKEMDKLPTRYPYLVQRLEEEGPSIVSRLGKYASLGYYHLSELAKSGSSKIVEKAPGAAEYIASSVAQCYLKLKKLVSSNTIEEQSNDTETKATEQHYTIEDEGDWILLYRPESLRMKSIVRGRFKEASSSFKFEEDYDDKDLSNSFKLVSEKPETNYAVQLTESQLGRNLALKEQLDYHTEQCELLQSGYLIVPPCKPEESQEAKDSQPRRLYPYIRNAHVTTYKLTTC